ncbi:hypothetical protein Tco_1353007 [Tanacetum coccineum]
MVEEVKVFNSYPSHKALYDALAIYLSIHEDGMDRIFGKSRQTKRRRDDYDKDPSPNVDKDSKNHCEVSESAACLEKLHFPALLVISKYSRICFSFVILEDPLSEYFGFGYTVGWDDIINIVSLRKHSSLV